MGTRWIVSLAALTLLGAQAAHAGSETPKPLFASHQVIHLTIGGQIRRLAANAPTSKAPETGTISEAGAASAPLAVTLSPRGISRRQADVCSFPPIRVAFSAAPPETSLFSGQKKLKLVTHCQSDAGFQQYLLLEYATYRIYNVMSPLSFDVRLASIDYVDALGRPIISRLGFFIEDEKDMAGRNGLREAATGDRIAETALQPRDAEREALFQYMIGNLDWAMTAGPRGAGCCHNTKLIAAKGATGSFIPVPYDFDSSGLVDPPYAAPPPGVTATDVKERQYRGYCLHNGEAPAAAAEILARRSAILAVLDEVPGLSEGKKRTARGYLDGFFAQIGTADGLGRILRNCLR